MQPLNFWLELYLLCVVLFGRVKGEGGTCIHLDSNVFMKGWTTWPCFSSITAPHWYCFHAYHHSARWLGKEQDWCVSRQLYWGHRIPAWRLMEGLPASKEAVRDTFSYVVPSQEVDYKIETAFCGVLRYKFHHTPHRSLCGIKSILFLFLF